MTSQLHPVPENCSAALSRTISKLPRMLYVLSSPSQYPSAASTADHKIFVSTPSMYCLTSGNVHEWTSHLHVASHLHPSSISPTTSSNHVQLTSILVPSHPGTGRDINITSIHIPSHLHQGPYSYISLLSRSRFTSTHVQTFASHLNPGNESALLCSWELHLSSQVSLQRPAGLKMYVFLPSNSCLTCT